MCRGFARRVLIMETCGCALQMHTRRKVTSLVRCWASCKVCQKTSRGQPTPCAVGAPSNVASRRLLWRAIVPLMCAVGARAYPHAWLVVGASFCARASFVSWARDTMTMSCSVACLLASCVVMGCAALTRMCCITRVSGSGSCVAPCRRKACASLMQRAGCLTPVSSRFKQIPVSAASVE